jgi:hypothetical protein
LAGISLGILISATHHHQATRKRKAKPNGLPLLPRPVSAGLGAQRAQLHQFVSVQG